ncbi:hypothetical protein [Galbibacter orientalis]|uniref:hypothetical protein n=1 Tax=Galbibacter orientalis TaxID=453852 RepID=UPI003080FB46
MKFLFVSICMVFLGYTSYAQVESTNTPIKLEGLNATQLPKENSNEATDLNIKATPDVEVPKKYVPKTPKKPSATDIANKEVDMMEIQEAFLDPGDRFEKKLNKKFNGSGDDGKMGATTTQYFGDFKSNAKSIKILCRDHQYVDGDRVSVIVNDKVVAPNIYLESSFKGIYIDLEKGFNKIEFKALNQGSSGPNTAQFAVFDDKGVEISSNIWNLATGVKASLLIIKEE